MVAVPRSLLAGAAAGARAARPRIVQPPAGWLGQAASTVGRRAPHVTPYAGELEPDKSWWQSVASGVLEGPIGSALSVLDLGRSAVVSTVKEGIDLVQGEGFSGSDWVDQVKTHYGFGDILREEDIDMGKWGNRVVGFIGDVAFDPITYITFGTGALQKMGYKEVADQLMDAKLFDAARRVRRSGSKLAAGGKDLRKIGYDIGFGFSMPGTGLIGRGLRLDKALNRITGGKLAGRRAAEWAPAFETIGAKFGMKAGRAQSLFTEAVNKGRKSARQMFDEEAKLLAPRQVVAEGGGDVLASLGRTAEEISDELLDVYARARSSRVELFWRNGKVGTTGPEWTRAVPGAGAEAVTGTMAARGGLRFGNRENIAIRYLGELPGRGFQAVMRGKLGQIMTKNLSRTAQVNSWISEQIASGNPVGYWAGRALETGDHIGFARRGQYAEVIDRLQSEMLDAAHKGGFDIWGVEVGPLGQLVGKETGEAALRRREGSRILYEASGEPWEYADGTLNPNLDEFTRWVGSAGDGTIDAQTLHGNLRKFWDDAGTEWERISNRSLREALSENERYVTRTMSDVAREGAKGEGWYKTVEAAARMGEREAADVGRIGKRAVRDVAYATKERVFVPGFRFTWKGQNFEILRPGTAGKAGVREYTHAPSVQRQIENFVTEVDPKFADRNVTFFDTDFGKVLDRYKQAQGRELIWGGIEDHLVAKGIFVDARTLADGNSLMDDITRGVRGNRTHLNRLDKRSRAVAENEMEAAARARSAMDEGDLKAQQAAAARGDRNAVTAKAAQDIDALDARVAGIQRTLMNMSEEVQEGIVKGVDGKFRTAPQAAKAMEDLLEMAVGLEATTRLAQMLRTVADSIQAQGVAQGVVGDVVPHPQIVNSLNKAYQDILFQLKVAQDMLQVVKNQAARLGGLDKSVREVEALIDGLLGKSRHGLARKDAPKYIQHYVDQVHEVGRLADELDAGITFNAAYRKPLFRATRMSPAEIEAGRVELYNRDWVEKTRRKLQQQLDQDAAQIREGNKLAEEGSVFARIEERVPILEAEAERLTILDTIRQADDEVLRLNDEATRAYVLAAREEGVPGAAGLRTKTVREWQATALDIESQRAAAEARILQGGFDDLGYEGGIRVAGKKNPVKEILIEDIAEFQQAENIFEGLLKGREGVSGEQELRALVAGFQDGMLPFGPVYSEGGGQMFMSALGSKAANEEFVHLMRSTMNVGQGEMGALLKLMDSLTGYFKAQAVARPSFIQRNILGALFNNMVAGMDVGNAGKYMVLRHRAMKAGWGEALRRAGIEQREWGTFRDFLGKRPATLKRAAAEIGAEKLAAQGDSGMRDLRRVYRSGAIGAGQAASEVAQSFRLGGATTLDRYGRPLRWNMLRRDNVWNTAVRNGHEEAEEIVRGMLAFDSVGQGLNDAAVIARVNKYHFNYSKDAMTDFERQYLSRAYPFYTWTRNIIPLMATEMVRNPKPFLRYLQLKNSLEMGVEEDRQVPAHYGQRWGIDMSALLGDPNQGARAWVFPDMPFMDLVDIASVEAPERLLAGLAPQIKTPIEVLMGKQFFAGLPVGSKYIKPPVIFDIPGLLPFLETLPTGVVKKNSRGEYGIRENAVFALQNFVPYISQMRRLVPREERYDRKLLSAWVSWLSPLGYYDPKRVAYDRNGNLYRRRKERGVSKTDWRSLEAIR